MICKIGEAVFTTNGHMGKVIKRYKPTASEITIQIQEEDGRIYYCPEAMAIKLKCVMADKGLNESNC